MDLSDCLSSILDILDILDSFEPSPIEVIDSDGQTWQGLIRTPKGTEVILQIREEKSRFRQKRMFLDLYLKKSEKLIETVELVLVGRGR